MRRMTGVVGMEEQLIDARRRWCGNVKGRGEKHYLDTVADCPVPVDRKRAIPAQIWKDSVKKDMGLIGNEHKHLSSICNSLKRKAREILYDPTHPLNDAFQKLPSGRR